MKANKKGCIAFSKKENRNIEEALDLYGVRIKKLKRTILSRSKDPQDKKILHLHKIAKMEKEFGMDSWE